MNTSNAPLVSFIITYYNLPIDMIKECLDSIMSLPLRRDEREVIFIDDGSDTSPITDLDAYKDDIIYIRHKNSGLSVARNIGLHMANGRYIQFVDGDDKLIVQGYGQCLDIVRHNEPDVVMFGYTCNEKVRIKNNVPIPQDGAHYMRHNNLRPMACGYTFKRNIIGNLRFTPGIFHEDEEFTPQLILRAEKVYSLDITAYFYRERPMSLTRNTDKRHIIKRLNDLESVIYHLDYLADMLTSGNKQALNRRVAQITMDYIYNIVAMTRSAKQLEERIKRLEAKGLFPLPDRNYTLKYALFRQFSKSRLIRKIVETLL